MMKAKKGKPKKKKQEKISSEGVPVALAKTIDQRASLNRWLVERILNA